MKIDEIIKKLLSLNKKIFSLLDLKKLLSISSDNTTYKTLEKLVTKEIVIRLKNGIYACNLAMPNEFEIAQHLSAPSYISCETALNFYGILSQFPYTITSVTLKKSQKFNVLQKEYDFAHIQKNLFWGYYKEDNFLIASPEKALLDQIYLASKGFRTLDLSELDYSKIDKKKLYTYIKKISYKPFVRYCKMLKI